MSRTSQFQGALSRRQFFGVAAAAGAGLALPTIVPSRIFGEDAPSRRLRVAQIGCGRIAHDMDMPGVLSADMADYVAVCDLDSKRAEHAKLFIESYCAKSKRPVPKIDVYGHYKEILARSDIDAVVISTPDHWHAEPAAAAALAGKDVWLQKPLAMAVAESRAVCDTGVKSGRILQIGSQQRSWPGGNFRRGCEYVRSGRIGKLTRIEIGLPKDETKPDDPEQPVPANLNYDAWLGCTPMAYYTEQRVHSQKEISKIRPGWLRNEDHCLGMITGWGSHHYDIAHWGMGIVEGGPLTVEGEAEFPKNKIWNVHLGYHIQLTYPGGIVVDVTDKHPNGVRFIGDEGWIFVSRGAVKASASDPNAGQAPLKALDASKPSLITGAPSVELYKSTHHHKNWLECVKSRKEPIAPVTNGHHVFAACAVSWIAMKLGRKLTWDAKSEKFTNDEAANKMLKRAERGDYGVFNLLAKQKV